jgi:hypothetical protein
MTSKANLLPLVVVLLQGTCGFPVAPALSAIDAATPTACYLVEVAPNASVDKIAAHAAEATGGLVVRTFTKLARGFAICLPAGTDPAVLAADPDVVRVDADPGASVPDAPDDE